MQGVYMFVPIPGHDKFEISKDGIIRNIKTKAFKSQYIGGTGYYMVTFSYNNKSYPRKTHRLLASAFIPNPENKPEINHKDGIKINNSLDNLEWCTHKENMEHAFKIGLVNNTGENNGHAKLKEPEVVNIKKLLQQGVSQYKIASQYGVSRSCIATIKSGSRWGHV